LIFQLIFNFNIFNGGIVKL